MQKEEPLSSDSAWRDVSIPCALDSAQPPVHGRGPRELAVDPAQGYFCVVLPLGTDPVGQVRKPSLNSSLCTCVQACPRLSIHSYSVCPAMAVVFSATEDVAAWPCSGEPLLFTPHSRGKERSWVLPPAETRPTHHMAEPCAVPFVLGEHASSHWVGQAWGGSPHPCRLLVPRCSVQLSSSFLSTRFTICELVFNLIKII